MVQGRLVRLSLGAAAGFALSIATPLFGQEAAPAPAAEPAVQPKPGGVEEIIVTATKREANIQEIPIAVSAFQGDELTERGIDEVEDLTQVSPSIQINTSNSASNGGTLRIRGMGTTGNNPGLEAAVGTFIDGVLSQPRRTGLQRSPRHRARRDPARPAGHAVRQEHVGWRGQRDHQEPEPRRGGGLRAGRVRQLRPQARRRQLLRSDHRRNPRLPAFRPAGAIAMGSTRTPTAPTRGQNAIATCCAASCCGSRPRTSAHA